MWFTWDELWEGQMRRKRWMRQKARRKNRGVLPDDEGLLDEFRGPGRCEFCRRWCVAREAAHIVTRGFGGWSRMDIRINLVSLGSAYECGCHYHAHQGGRPTITDLLVIVAAREGRTPVDVQDELNMLKWNRS